VHGAVADVARLDVGWGAAVRQLGVGRQLGEPLLVKRGVGDFCRLSQCRWTR
jgi:hypothetical protein